MADAKVLAEIWRGTFLESQHLGHAVVVDAGGEIRHAWGDVEKIILPRSSCKMIQALPLVESGAAGRAGLGPEQLALACASHNGAAIHTDRVAQWLTGLGLADDAFRCGPQMPKDGDARRDLVKTDASPCQWHNNCSGKHAGFLTLNADMSGGMNGGMNGDANYIDPAHPVQIAVRAAFEEVTQMSSPGFVIDGCSAPNFATSLTGLARGMAFFANARADGSRREQAAVQLRNAMAQHPELVAGEGRACTELMRAMQGQVMIKTGAEGVFVAILPEHGLGVAVKIEDGAHRASEAAIAAILVKLGVLQADHPATQKFLNAPITNWRGTHCGTIRPGAALL